MCILYKDREEGLGGNMKTSTRYVIIVVFYIILITSIYFCFFCSRNEKYENIDINKVKLFNWWNMDTDSYNKTIYLFKDVLGDEILDKYKEIHIYSVFGQQKVEKTPDNLCIQYSGESYYSEPEKFDLNIIPDDKYVLFPHAYHHILMSGMNMTYFINKRFLTEPRDKFCLFSVSNGNSQVRNDFFNTLSKYKRVDSCGGHLNNMPSGERCPSDTNEYYEYISRYKFMICFENTSQKNYITEKLFNAYYGGAIPIYWGCSNVNDYINMNSILYLKPDYTDHEMQNLVREIIRLDNDDEAYNKRFSYELFRNGIVPDEFNIDKIKEKVSAAISRT